MKQERFELGKATTVTVTACHGDLVIRGWGETAVLVKGDNYDVQENEQELLLTGESTLRLMVPLDANLVVKEVHGDLVIKNVNGDLSLQSMYRDLLLANVGNAKIGVVHSDLSVKQLDGSLSVETIYGDAGIRHVNEELALGVVHGDLSARYVNGAASVGEVMGDAGLRYINGDVAIKQVLGDVSVRDAGGIVTLPDVKGGIRLYGPLPTGDHHLQANGDIVVRWPVDAHLHVTAVAPQINNRLNLEDLTKEEGALSGRLGKGGTNLSLQANGRILLKEGRLVDEKWDPTEGASFDFDDVDFDFEGLGELINEQVTEQVSRITAEFENKFGPDFSQRMAEKMARKAERAAAKAEKAAERALRRAERNMKRNWRPPAPPAPPRQPAKKRKVNPEEQLKILKMVEQGTITPEEANTLLEALED